MTFIGIEMEQKKSIVEFWEELNEKYGQEEAEASS